MRSRALSRHDGAASWESVSGRDSVVARSTGATLPILGPMCRVLCRDRSELAGSSHQRRCCVGTDGESPATGPNPAGRPAGPAPLWSCVVSSSPAVGLGHQPSNNTFARPATAPTRLHRPLQHPPAPPFARPATAATHHPRQQHDWPPAAPSTRPNDPLRWPPQRIQTCGLTSHDTISGTHTPRP